MINRRSVLAGASAAAAVAASSTLTSTGAFAQALPALRLSGPMTATDQRAIAMLEVFGPAVKSVADFQPHWNATLFKQGTELDAISRGNLEMCISSPQEFATLIPAWSIFTAGYLMRDAAHQVATFKNPIMDEFKKSAEDKLGVKLLSVMYLGRRQINLRSEKEIKTPADLAGVRLRMPPSEAWQFLGSALGASPLPMAFGELYTALQTGAVDGQDNPLPTVRDSKFFEVTKQIVLTSHLVDLNFITISKKFWDGLKPEQQKVIQDAADKAAEAGRVAQLKLEGELEAFFKEKGLKVYTPDVEAFRTKVLKDYAASKFAKDWPAGMVDKISAIK
jgi:TRAP-type transport system periplasmic protein